MDPRQLLMALARRARLHALTLASGALALALAGAAARAEDEPAAQPAGAEEESERSSDPSLAEDIDPSRLVFFNLRLTHAELGDGNSSDVLLLRRDVAIRKPHSGKPGKRFALLRFDLPVGQVNLAGERDEGLGDLYAQALRVREYPGPFYLSYGLAMTLPTATANTLGTGQWQVAPTFIPTWSLKKSRALAFVRIQDSFSVAGDEDRPDVHDLTVNGSYAKMISRRTFVMFETEAVVDWTRGDRIFWKSGLTWGGLVKSGRLAW